MRPTITEFGHSMAFDPDSVDALPKDSVDVLPNVRPRIAIADDDASILEQVAGILESRFEVVVSAANGRILVDGVDETGPSIVVTDFSMPEMNGIAVTKAILRAHPGVKVVVLSVHDDPAYMEAAFDAGASGYVLKIDASEELIPAVDAVLSGGSYRSRRLA